MNRFLIASLFRYFIQTKQISFVLQSNNFLFRLTLANKFQMKINYIHGNRVIWILTLSEASSNCILRIFHLQTV